MRTPPIDTSGWPPAARQYVERLQAIIERDRTEVARGLRAVKEAIRGHEWLRLGRGSYEYDDDRWKDEFGEALDAIEQAMEPLRSVASNLNDSPVEAEAVAAARADFVHALERIRSRRWSVAVHNDYTLGAKRMTFWLFTHPNGHFAKGEGADDLEALLAAEIQVKAITCAGGIVGCYGGPNCTLDHK